MRARIAGPQLSTHLMGFSHGKGDRGLPTQSYIAYTNASLGINVPDMTEAALKTDTDNKTKNAFGNPTVTRDGRS
jgi:hypothetical protein